jgi:site-specific DNA-methyltransferase (adenine-specific)
MPGAVARAETSERTLWSELLPPLDPEAFAALKADIALRGVQIPVELDEQGVVLDGHHRLRAIVELRASGVVVGSYPRVVRVFGADDDARLAHVLALNLARRHLGRAERGALVERLRSLGWSTTRIAEQVGVSEGTVRNDLASRGSQDCEPARSIGKDGKSYPARRAGVAAGSAAQEHRALRILGEIQGAGPELMGELASGRLSLEAAGRAARQRASGLSHRKAGAGRSREGGHGPTHPYYDDSGDLRLYHARFAEVSPETIGPVAAVVTSPPYNTGRDYGPEVSDELAWEDYEAMAAEAARLMAGVLVEGGRAFVVVAPVLPAEQRPPGSHSGRSARPRVLLARIWTEAMEAAGLALHDVIAWAGSPGPSGAWGSWQSPASPSLRAAWETVLVACKGPWARRAPATMQDWRDEEGRWPELCSSLWRIPPTSAETSGHPAAFPTELAARCIRLSTWPGESVLDPFAGSGATLEAARALGRRALGIEASIQGCEAAAARLELSKSKKHS